MNTANRPIDRRKEVITFEAADGKYQMTRGDRYRLAIMHRIPEAEARHLAYSAATVAANVIASQSTTFTPEEIYQRFHANGTRKRFSMARLSR